MATPSRPLMLRSDPSVPQSGAIFRMRASSSGLALHRVAHVQQNFEIQLLATICKIELRHLSIVSRGACTIEGFTVHLFKIRQNTIA